MTRRWLVVLVAACSGSSTKSPDAASASDATHDSAGSGGSACPANVITGTVTGRSASHTFGTIVRAYETYESSDSEWLIILDEQPSPDGMCATQSTTGFNLAFGFAQQPAPGSFTIITPGTGTTPATQCIAVAQQDGNANLAIADGGTLTLESGGASCLAGHFTAAFGSDSVTGTFGAATCN